MPSLVPVGPGGGRTRRSASANPYRAGIVNLTDPGRLCAAPSVRSGRAIGEQRPSNPSRRAANATSIPWAAKLTMPPTSIGRVYDVGRVERVLGFRCATDFSRMLHALRSDRKLPRLQAGLAIAKRNSRGVIDRSERPYATGFVAHGSVLSKSAAGELTWNRPSVRAGLG